MVFKVIDKKFKANILIEIKDRDGGQVRTISLHQDEWSLDEVRDKIKKYLQKVETANVLAEAKNDTQ